MSEDDSNSSMELSPQILYGKNHVRPKANPNPGVFNGQVHHNTNTGEPFLTIEEEPKSRGFRFRYACEGKSHGGIQGQNSGRTNKSFPSVKIHNFSGRARVIVKLVTDEAVPRPHAHELIGKNCRDGQCIVETNCAATRGEVTFPNMGILHVTRKRVKDILVSRIKDEMKVNRVMNDSLHHLDINDIFLTGEEELAAENQAEQQAKDMQLNVVRLCFQAYLANEKGAFSRILPSVVSQPIFDCKSPGAAALKICRMDKHAGCCTGNDEVFLLCDKVQKEDISVRFFEEDDDNDVKWEGFGNFGPADVHRQYAIVFRTPPYSNTTIDKPVTVLVQLRRTSDGETSDAKPFTYYPQQKDQDEVIRKRSKPLPYFTSLNQTASNVITVNTVPNNGFPPQTFNMMTPQMNGVNTLTAVSATPGQVGQVVLQNGTLPNQAFVIQSQMNAANAAPINFTSRGPSPDDKNSQSIHPMTNGVGSPPSQSNGPLELTAKVIKPALTVIQSNGAVEMTGRGMAPSVPLSKARKLKLSGSARTDLEEDSCPFDEDEVDSRPSALCNKNLDQVRCESGYLSYNSGSCQSMEQLKTASAPAKEELVLAAGSACRRMAAPVEIIAGLDTTVDTMKQTGHESKDTEVEITVEVCKDGDSLSVQAEDTDTPAQDNEESSAEKDKQETAKTNTQTPATTDASDVQELAWRVAENTALALQEFAKTGNIAYLLVIQRHLVAVQDENGDNAVHMAVINRRVEPLRSLLCAVSSLQNESAINCYNSLQQTPLHLAVIINQPDMVELLVKNGADISLVDRNGNNPLHLAALSGYDRCLQNLLSACPASHLLTSVSPVNQLNYDGFSPVHLGVRQGSLNCVRHLVNSQADINLADGKSGYTALHHAAESENLGIVGYLLLEAAADPNNPSYSGHTALHIAVGRDLLGIAALLIASGADPESESTELPSSDEEESKHKTKETVEEVRGITPMDMAEGNYRMVQILSGEPYASVSDSTNKCETTPTLYSGLLDSGLGLMSSEGDLDKLDLVTRVKLGKLLDTANAEHTQGWKVLAQKMGLETLSSALSTMKSPTRAVLDNIEVLDGTVEKLMAALQEMGRTDCVDVIKEGLALHEQAAKDLAEKRKAKETLSCGINDYKTTGAHNITAEIQSEQ